MKDKPTKEELERVFSDSGTLEERLSLYPYLRNIITSLPKGKSSDFYSELSKMGVSEKAQITIESFLSSSELEKRIKVARKVASARETLKLNTKGYKIVLLQETQELEEAIDSLNLYGLLLSIREAVSPKEWGKVLNKTEEYLKNFLPKVLVFRLLRKEEDRLRYDFRAFEILSKSILEEAIARKFSLLMGVDTIESIIEENHIRNFFSEDLLSTLEEARKYIKEAESYFLLAEKDIEDLLRKIPLNEDEKETIKSLLSPSEKKNTKGVYFIFENASNRVYLSLPEYVDLLRNMKIKKSDYEKIKKQILSGK